MVVSNKVMITVNATTYKYWISKGYHISPYIDKKGRHKNFKQGTQIEVLVSDLPPRSNVLVEAKCDICGRIRTVTFSQDNRYCWKCNLDRQKGTAHPRYNPNFTLTGQDRIDDMRLVRLYGIDLSTYNSMLESQDYKCYICKKSQDDEPRKFTVDHNHKTGAVRGLLCNKCNRGIGIFADSTELLESAINYIRRFE